MDDSKIIFTMTTKDDLYVVGSLPDSMWDRENLEAKELLKKYDNRFVTITDDYMPVSIRSKEKDIKCSCETTGSFLLVTKREWDSEFMPVIGDPYKTDIDHTGENYAIICKDYIGPVAIDIYSYPEKDESSRSILKAYDGKELMYQPDENIDGRGEMGLADYCVIVNTGHNVKSVDIRSLCGLNNVVKHYHQDIYIDTISNELYYDKEADGKENVVYVGERKIIDSYWIKNETNNNK